MRVGIGIMKYFLRPFTVTSLLNEPLRSDMTVYAKWTENELPFIISSIAVDTDTLKNTYLINESLDLTNAKLILYYTDYTNSQINLTLDMISGYDTQSLGEKDHNHYLPDICNKF